MCMCEEPGATRPDHWDTAPPPPRPALDELRRQILACDQELIRVLGRRQALVQDIGRLKAKLGLPVTDPQREATVVRRAARLARDAGLDEELVREVIWKVMAFARARQDPPSDQSGDAKA